MRDRPMVVSMVIALDSFSSVGSTSYQSRKAFRAAMADPMGETERSALRLDFDRRLLLQFRGSTITSDGGLLAYRELDDVLALTMSGGERLAEARTGKNR